MTTVQTQAYITAPGNDVSNIYISEESIKKSNDMVIFDNRDIIQLPSQSMSGQGVSVVIPQGGFVSEMILRMQIPALYQGNANTQLGIVPIPAMTIIQYVEWVIGGSTTYRYDGTSSQIWSTFIDCETQGKRDELASLAGGSGNPNYWTLCGGSGTSNMPGITYYAHINVPWSNINGQSSRKVPIDTNLMSQPMRVNFYFRGANSIFYNASSGGTSSLTLPTNFTYIDLQIRTGRPLDRSKLLKLNRLVEDPVTKQLKEENSFYSVPFVFEQWATTSQFAGSISPSQQTTVQLLGFKTGNCMEVRLHLYNVGSGIKIQVPATSATDYLGAEDPINPDLYFAGTKLTSNISDSYKQWAIEFDSCPGFARTSQLGTRRYWVSCPLSQYLPKNNSEEYQSGLNFGSQTLTVLTNTLTTDNYQFFVNFLYSANMIFDGKTVDIVF